MDEHIGKIIDKQIEMLNTIKEKCWNGWGVDPLISDEVIVKTGNETILAIYQQVNSNIRGEEADKSRKEIEMMRNKRYSKTEETTNHITSAQKKWITDIMKKDTSYATFVTEELSKWKKTIDVLNLDEADILIKHIHKDKKTHEKAFFITADKLRNEK